MGNAPGGLRLPGAGTIYLWVPGEKELARLADGRIFASMDDMFEHEIYVVIASGNGKSEFWAAATTRERALAEVRQHWPLGWIVALTEHYLTPHEATALGIRPNGVRKLRYVQ
jgi:hypothetical protein